MSIKATLKRRGLLLLGITALLSALLTPMLPAPASAQADCTGTGGSRVFDGTCNDGDGGGGGGSYESPIPGVTWHIIEDYDRSIGCVNRVGEQSYRALVYGTYSDGSIAQASRMMCVVSSGGTNDALKQQARIVVPKPSFESDYNNAQGAELSKFLTGAPVKFTMSEPGVLWKQVPGFNAWVEARPTSYEWDFGDGTTSTSPSPTKIYNSKSPNPGDPDNHVVTVTLRVIYSGTLHLDSTGINDPSNGVSPVEDLGDIVVDESQQWTIVEVWSALTERK